MGFKNSPSTKSNSVKTSRHVGSYLLHCIFLDLRKAFDTCNGVIPKIKIVLYVQIHTATK